MSVNTDVINHKFSKKYQETQLCRDCNGRFDPRAQEFQGARSPSGMIVFVLHHLLHKISDIDREEREYDHTENGQDDSHNLTHTCHRLYVAAYGDDVHAAPPQCIPVRRDERIGRMLPLEENERPEITHKNHNRDIADEQRRHRIRRKISEYDGYGECAAGQRDKPDEIHGIVTQVESEPADYIEIRYRQKQKKQMRDEIPPAVVGIDKRYEKVGDEENAHPQLKPHESTGREQIDFTECVVRYPHNQNDRQQEYDKIEESHDNYAARITSFRFIFRRIRLNSSLNG